MEKLRELKPFGLFLVLGMDLAYIYIMCKLRHFCKRIGIDDAGHLKKLDRREIDEEGDFDSG